MTQCKKRGVEIRNATRNTVIRDVAVRDTVPGQVKGLMFQDTGRILMAFNGEDTRRVWMPFVRFSLDVVFISAERTVLGVTSAVPLTWHPSTWRIYTSPDPCQYVLEVEHGLTGDKKWETGDRLTWS